MCVAVRKIHLFLKLKEDFLQSGRNILPIQIMNDSSHDTNIKVIQLSKSYLCFTSFPFINNLSGRNDCPHGLFANTCCSSCFAITAPALNCGLFPLLLSSWKYFVTFSIICCSSTLICFSALSLGTPWKWWNDVSHVSVDPKGKLARTWATFYNRRHQLSNKFLCLCCQWRPLLCQT